MRWGDVQENITNIRAITHNGTVKKYVGAQSMYDSNMSGNYSVKKFTFPDIKDGSILEYIYRIETPMLSNLGTWRFMNECLLFIPNYIWKSQEITITIAPYEVLENWM